MRSVTDRPRYAGTPEAARRLGVHPSTLFRWYKKGTAEPVPTAGKRLQWDVPALRAARGLPPESDDASPVWDQVRDVAAGRRRSLVIGPEQAAELLAGPGRA